LAGTRRGLSRKRQWGRHGVGRVYKTQAGRFESVLLHQHFCFNQGRGGEAVEHAGADNTRIHRFESDPRLQFFADVFEPHRRFDNGGLTLTGKGADL
jgi:hypothetical protein